MPTQNLLTSSRRILYKKLLIVMQSFVILATAPTASLFLTSAASAASDDDFFENGLRATTEKAKERAYTGARDEQNLEVQASLPQPQRATEGVALTQPVDDEDASPPPPTAPTSD